MRLPERFLQQPQPKQLAEYIARHYSQYGSPRAHYILYNPEWTPDGGSRERYRWIEYPSRGLRFVGTSHDIVRISHTGWFTDDSQDETVHGEVYQLPARGGEPQYVPAVNDPVNDAAVVDFHSVTSDKEDAARWADSMAESYAEREREYRAKDQAEQRVAEIDDEIKAEYSAFRSFARELRASCDAITGIAVVHALVREHWEGVKERIHELRAEREKVESEGISY